MTAGRSILAAATLIALDPNEIDVSGRIGFYFPDKAEAFASLMTIDGQRDPIKVSRNPAGAALPWRLHVGLHRTMGARMAGLPVYGLEVSGTPEELRELESSENLHRRDIEPIERAKFVFHTCEAARVRIARQHGNLKQQQLAVKARWARVKAGDDRAEQALGDEVGDTSDKLSLVYGWADAAAEALGFGKRTTAHDYRVTSRGGKGIMAANISPQTGNLVACCPAGDDDGLVLTTDGGQTIRTRVGELRTSARMTKGVRTFKLPAGQKIVGVVVVGGEDVPETPDDLEAEAAEAPAGAE